jgi:YD repeat-containing protein
MTLLAWLLRRHDSEVTTMPLTTEAVQAFNDGGVAEPGKAGILTAWPGQSATRWPDGDDPMVTHRTDPLGNDWATWHSYDGAGRRIGWSATLPELQATARAYLPQRLAALQRLCKERGVFRLPSTMSRALICLAHLDAESDLGGNS